MSISFLGRVQDSSEELVGEDFGGISACVSFVDLEPGEGPRLHKHPYAELFFAPAGESTFTDGIDSRVVKAGDFVIASADQPHAFVNSGEATASSNGRSPESPLGWTRLTERSARTTRLTF
jgi:quercetin dioxygenase-like cupin family protein